MTMTPDRPRTAAATEAVVRRGQETKAAALRERGWIVIPPEMLTHGTFARIDRVCEVEGFTREEAAQMLIARGLIGLVPATRGDTTSVDQMTIVSGDDFLRATFAGGRRSGHP